MLATAAQLQKPGVGCHINSRRKQQCVWMLRAQCGQCRNRVNFSFCWFSHGGCMCVSYQGLCWLRWLGPCTLRVEQLTWHRPECLPCTIPCLLSFTRWVASPASLRLVTPLSLRSVTSLFAIEQPMSCVCNAVFRALLLLLLCPTRHNIVLWCQSMFWVAACCATMYPLPLPPSVACL